ncbi:MotA/TolQ/ExbB proton channel family protein [candidate division TA06 bacterium]|uniref:MotA/TolQ/ExbB proton channel family protein n=1 Tax=candidate division TA06 bacterium TaxID=2250710 RepID=A0A523XP76_UNCT6|nr:MAG: MotA/TolQ/ExbB proton channel family protein [candidate division TA06 bacterium]
MVDLFLKGGPVMYPLLACGIIGLVFIIERLVSYVLAATNPTVLVAAIKDAYKSGGYEQALEVCDRSRSPIARILAVALKKHQQLSASSEGANPAGDYGRRRADIRREIEDAVSLSGSTELAFLDRGMLVLAGVSTIAPILGFLGTVAGMIRAFDAIAIAGEVEATLVARGISEALITTATGLAIAAPVVAFHVYFTSRINTYTRNMEVAANELISDLVE